MSVEKIPQCYASSVQRITSRQNAIVAAYRAAARGGTEGLLLDGTHLVGEALSAGIRLRHVMVALDAIDTPEMVPLLAQLSDDVDVASANSTVMAAASPVRSSSRIVALGDRPPLTRGPFDGEAHLVVVACDVQDPGNVGAIIRVAEGAGATGVVVAGQSADPFAWKALRGSMGSALRLPIVAVPTIEEAVADARRHHSTIVATVPRDGVSLFESRLRVATTLLIGGEGSGLPASVVAAADVRVTIPMDAPVESLNAAVATAVLLYEARRQRLDAQAPTGRGRSSARSIVA